MFFAVGTFTLLLTKGHGSDGGSSNTSGGAAESGRGASQRDDGQSVSSLAGGMAQLGIGEASGSKGGGRGAAAAGNPDSGPEGMRSATASTTTTESAELHGRPAGVTLEAPECLSGDASAAGSLASPEGHPGLGRSFLAGNVTPAGSLWEQGVPERGGGGDWGRPSGAGAGGVEGVGAGTGARGLDGGKPARGSSTGSEGGEEEWDAGDGTVALRHLQNLAAQLPYSAWQVGFGGERQAGWVGNRVTQGETNTPFSKG